jgi:hypothetical protein
MTPATRRRFRTLEIGSGNAPDPRADVLVDRFPWDDRERARHEPIRRDGRSLIAADGAALPFASKTFDLVIALNVLEHTDDPCGFLREMSRVGRRGLVHVPTTFTERLFYREFHKFTFALDGKTLVIRKKNFPDVFGGLFDYLAHFDPDFIRFKERNRGLFELVYAWEGEASYRIEAYDPTRPCFASFEKTYQGRPFPFRLTASELLESQVENLLAKEPPRSWRQRLRGWGRGVLNVGSRGRP